jgi:hypothetical protein
VPPDRPALGHRAWPTAQARPVGLIFGPGQLKWIARNSVPGWPMAHQRGEGRQQGIGKEATAWPSWSPPWPLRVRGEVAVPGSFHGHRGRFRGRCESEQARKARSLRRRARPWHRIWRRCVEAVGEEGGARPSAVGAAREGRAREGEGWRGRPRGKERGGHRVAGREGEPQCTAPRLILALREGRGGATGVDA